MKTKLSLLIATGAMLWAASLAAQTNFGIPWFTTAGGGGTRTGGVYSVTATIGQVEAGTALAGGNYSLSGGFWSLFSAVQTSGAPLLLIKNSNKGVVVSWPASSGGWILEQTTQLLPAPNQTLWTSVTSAPVVVSGNQNTVTFYPAIGNRFFRLRHP